MANSNFETTLKQGGKAVDETAAKTGQQAGNVYEQAKNVAADAYGSAAEYAGSAAESARNAVSQAQDKAAELDEMVSDQVGRHPKAVVALGIGLGFVLGVLFASSRNREPSWRDYARWN